MPIFAGTLRFGASNSAPGRRIVFDYFLESAFKTPYIVALNTRLTALGEPMIWASQMKIDIGSLHDRA